MISSPLTTSPHRRFTLREPGSPLMPDWTHTPHSSNVAAFRYDDDSRTLHVRFKSGRTYTYANVPDHHHDGLRDADSVGKYLREHIVGAFDHKRG